MFRSIYVNFPFAGFIEFWTCMPGRVPRDLSRVRIKAQACPFLRLLLSIILIDDAGLGQIVL